MSNILDIKVSRYKTLSDNKGTETNLFQFLTTPIKSIDLDKLRAKYPDSEEFKKYVKPKLPAITPSGIFNPTRASANLLKHTGLMVVDIDFKEQKIDMDIIYSKLKSWKYIAYLGKSCSGKGLFGIMPIAHPNEHTSHFLSIEKELANMDIVIDSSCKDITRMRLYSYDADAYFNLNAVPYTDLYIASPKPYSYVSTTLDLEDEKLQNMIMDIQNNHINITETDSDWFRTATILNSEFGEEGRELFHIISSQSSKYDESECDEMFDRMNNRHYERLGIGTLYYLYDEAKKKIKLRSLQK
jgi:hypothetical protein